MAGPLSGGLCYSLYGDGGRIARLLRREPVELYCIGASVTAQRDGWPSHLLAQLRVSTGQDHRLRLNAMGGVGLLFGLAHHHLHPPDKGTRVAFVEFSTGDLNLGLTPLDQLTPWLEELVGQLQFEGTPVVFVHNWRADFDADDRAGIRRRYDAVAERHAIPVIQNHLFAAARIIRNPELRAAWFRDLCHTHPPGAQAYAGHICACLWAMGDAPAISAIAPPGTLPSNFTRPVLPDPAPTLVTHDYGTYTYAHTGQSFPVTTVPVNTTLRWQGCGRLLGLGLLSGPRTGWVHFEVDGQPIRRLRAFDRHSHFERYILLATPLNLEGQCVQLRCSDDEVDFSVAVQSHPDFALPRQLKFIHAIGQHLSLQSMPTAC